MQTSNLIAIATLSAALAAGSAVAAPAETDSFAALQGVESIELSAVEMDAITGQLTVADVQAYINKLPATSPLKAYLNTLLSKNLKLVTRIVAVLTRFGF